ncbi:sensor histidine kinase [uncultured Desulfosarcina sp.]|uniref:sensor histidine kinase n=1 Tax=uncultured Desulfosarcina sp. TaxID=218289 RepID=UPI0029C91C78|nr:sensor histidine kinase [uncultured Desulfosarcina sp.]
MITPHLDIDAHVVHQLGDELITDSEQALLELVKNSYDADAEWCNVIIDTEAVETVKRSISSNDKSPVDGKSENATDSVASQIDGQYKMVELVGIISVEDNGFGMSPTDIQRGWLTVSISPKRAMKAKGRVTPKFKRTPIGDKGLGRLGTMRLGDRLVIKTFHSPTENGHKVTIFWNDCESGRPLSTIPVDIEELPASGSTGTVIEISGLRDIPYWIGEPQLKRLEMKLSTFISPFRSFTDFTVALRVDKHDLNLVSFPARFFDTALGKFDFVWDKGELSLQGAVKLPVFKGNDPDFFEQHVLPDSGDELLQYLLTHKRLARYTPKKPNSKNWFLELSDLFSLQDVSADVPKGTKRADPGPFLGEIYMFHLRGGVGEIREVASRIKDYTQYVKELSGVYVYRDNFRIRLGKDWLNLGEQWTSGGSWYGLRPGNAIGFFAISGQDNPDLIEKSDRESFVDNDAWSGFWALAVKFRDFANNTLEEMRRTYNEFRSKKVREEARLPKIITVKQSAIEIGELMAVSAQVGEQVKEASASRTVVLKNAMTGLDHAIKSNSLPNELRTRFMEALDDIKNLLQQVTKESSQVQEVLTQFADKQGYINVINNRFEQLEEQISEVYETVGIGLVAQALAHEVHPTVDEIGARVRSIADRLRKVGVKDPQITGDLESVRAHAVMVGKKLSFIDPMLRTFRETKHEIVLSEFMSDFFALRNDRFERFGIQPFIECVGEGDFCLRINKGRLTQVVDNLTRNSVYWLRSMKIHDHKYPLAIHVVIESPRMTFWDTGPGVRKGMEDACFEIFTTDKPPNEGHGLGLFIARQLLEEEGCSIFLAKDRNKAGRRFKFVVDFSGVVQE